MVSSPPNIGEPTAAAAQLETPAPVVTETATEQSSKPTDTPTPVPAPLPVPLPTTEQSSEPTDAPTPVPTTEQNSEPTDTPSPVPVPAPVVGPVLGAIEPDTDDSDSTLGGESGSEFNFGSVTSSIFNYRVENGRTYHAYSDGKYLIPNDEREQDRLDIVYHAILRMFDGVSFFAPVTNPQRIADMGTGTGIWALDVGDQYPEAQVIGIDLSPIQPKWTSPNVEFRIDDIEKSWAFDAPLDLVHSRLCSGNAIRNWPHYLSEAYKCLRPGGWVEAQEFNLKIRTDDNSLPENSKIQQWHDKFHEGMMMAGCNLSQSSQDVKGYMEEAGFVNVEVIDLKFPIAPWPKEKRLKEAGAYAMLSMMEDITGMSLAVFTRLLAWDRIELELFLADVRAEWKMKGVHAYWPLFSVYGQRPFEKTDEEEVEIETGPGAIESESGAVASAS